MFPTSQLFAETKGQGYTAPLPGQHWHPAESTTLVALVQSKMSWASIAQYFPHRSAGAVRRKWLDMRKQALECFSDNPGERGAAVLG
jgi:hypothetical protein